MENKLKVAVVLLILIVSGCSHYNNIPRQRSFFNTKSNEHPTKERVQFSTKNNKDEIVEVKSDSINLENPITVLFEIEESNRKFITKRNINKLIFSFNQKSKIGAQSAILEVPNFNSNVESNYSKWKEKTSIDPSGFLIFLFVVVLWYLIHEIVKTVVKFKALKKDDDKLALKKFKIKILTKLCIVLGAVSLAIFLMAFFLDYYILYYFTEEILVFIASLLFIALTFIFGRKALKGEILKKISINTIISAISAVAAFIFSFYFFILQTIVY